MCVAYFFPPVGGVSVARTLSFVRNLPATGWHAIVLAPRGSAYPLRDPDRLAAIPRTAEVVRALSPEPGALRDRVGRIRARWRPASGRTRRATSLAIGETATEHRPSAIPPDADRSRPGSRRPALAHVRQLVFFPDDQLLWLPFAVRAGYRAARESRADAIYSTSSPVTAHLIAGIIHRLTGIPWVAEFRDPWVGNVLAAPLPWLHRQLQRRLERWIVTSAARVVFLSPETAAIYERRYPGLADRCRVIPNGYDADELGEREERTQKSTPFRLVYTGTLDRPREAAAFMSGVDLAIARRPDLASRLAIDFIGHTSPDVEAIAAPYLVPGRLGSVIHFAPFAPRTEVLDSVRKADACLVLLGGERGMSQFLPGKLFDYIGLDAPVLAVVPDGEVRSVLRQLQWGILADPTPQGVAEGLERLMAGEHRTGVADPGGRFERRRQAAELGAVLTELTGGKGRPRLMTPPSSRLRRRRREPPGTAVSVL